MIQNFPKEAFQMTKKVEGKEKHVYYDHSAMYCGYGKIYTLSDKAGNVFYVGCTMATMRNRMAAHITQAKRNRHGTNRRKNEIIAGLNFEIVATIVDLIWITANCHKLFTNYKFKEAEKKWIKKYSSLGYDLCNREVIKKKENMITHEYVGQTFISKDDKIFAVPTEV